jgi:hypothetical protein
MPVVRATRWNPGPVVCGPMFHRFGRDAILVASHDVPFLRSAGITRWLRLDREAGLTVIDPL